MAVIGAGTMGGGISMNFLNAGIPVVMLEMKQEALDRGLATIRKNYESQVKRGKLKQDKYEQRMALLSTTLSYDDIKDADLVIHDGDPLEAMTRIRLVLADGQVVVNRLDVQAGSNS